MPGEFDGYRAAPVRRRLTPGRISSLPGTGGLPPSISSSTSCPELESTGRGLQSGIDEIQGTKTVVTQDGILLAFKLR